MIDYEPNYDDYLNHETDIYLENFYNDDESTFVPLDTSTFVPKGTSIQVSFGTRKESDYYGNGTIKSRKIGS